MWDTLYRLDLGPVAGRRAPIPIEITANERLRPLPELLEKAPDVDLSAMQDHAATIELLKQVGELDLVDQEVGHRAVVVFVERLTPVLERLGSPVVAQEARRVHDRDHRVEARDLTQAHTVFVFEGEGLRDRDRLRDPSRLDEQVVEASLLREP